MPGLSSTARRIKKLRTEGLALVESGDLRGALERFVALEGLEPSEPDWPRRAAECHRQLGERAEQLAALSRAAGRYVGAGMVVKAMAICKIMLALEPENRAALECMQKLEPPLGVQRVAPHAAAVARIALRAAAPTPQG
jgi:hypothetical protein